MIEKGNRQDCSRLTIHNTQGNSMLKHDVTTTPLAHMVQSILFNEKQI